MPVPTGWLVVDQTLENAVLVSTKSRIGANSGITSAPVINIRALRNGTKDLDLWESVEKHEFQSQGRTPERHALQFGNEQLLCIGGEILPELASRGFLPVMGMSCKSTSDLEVTFTGNRADLDEVYSLLIRIRK
ncbi:MAG: hypothetical protein JWO13_3000 [Acidobacteriales bacterium]|nr:hypothetical protein [Terriglobales bacterium]